jgi:hypothetical protein
MSQTLVEAISRSSSTALDITGGDLYYFQNIRVD